MRLMRLLLKRLVRVPPRHCAGDKHPPLELGQSLDRQHLHFGWYWKPGP